MIIVMGWVVIDNMKKFSKILHFKIKNSKQIKIVLTSHSYQSIIYSGLK